MDAPPQHPAHRYVERLLTGGSLLADLLDDLLDAFDGREPWPGEDNVTVLLEMVAGSVTTHLRDVPAGDFERTAALIERTVDSVLADLRRAHELSRRPPRGRRRGADMRASSHG